MQIYAGEVINFFREQKGSFETRYGVRLKMSKDEDSFYTKHQMPELIGMSVNLRLVIDVDSVHSFIDGFKLQHIQDIDRISYNYLWMRYLNGGGVFYAKHHEMKYEIGFRLISYKTIVFCKELHFYDEVNKHLTMPDEVEEWMEKNKRLVERVVEHPTTA